MGNNHVYVLLAVRNGERYIRQAIESVLNQTHQNFHIFIALNGCTDNTQKIVDEYRLNNPGKIKDFILF